MKFPALGQIVEPPVEGQVTKFCFLIHSRTAVFLEQVGPLLQRTKFLKIPKKNTGQMAFVFVALILAGVVQKLDGSRLELFLQGTATVGLLRQIRAGD
jgi:hypothetical protein